MIITFVLFLICCIFCSSPSLLDAEMLETSVAKGVADKTLNTTIKFDRPMRHPFGSTKVLAYGVVIQKVYNNKQIVFCLVLKSRKI
jgi:hypothetical protein